MWALAVASFTASYRVLVVFSGPFGIFITDHWWVPADQVLSRLLLSNTQNQPFPPLAAQMYPGRSV